MARSLDETIGGIFCCLEPIDEPWCNDCPYEHIKDCQNMLQSDICHWAGKGKLEACDDGIWRLKIDPPKIKTKRKNGRRYSDGERRNNRQYDEE